MKNGRVHEANKGKRMEDIHDERIDEYQEQHFVFLLQIEISQYELAMNDSHCTIRSYFFKSAIYSSVQHSNFAFHGFNFRTLP